MTTHALKSMTSETTDQNMQTLIEKIESVSTDFQYLTQKVQSEKLKQCRCAFLQKDEFEPGQLISWKEDMRNRKWPEYEQPAIVVEVLQTPKSDFSNPGSPYYGEPLDLVIGVQDNEEDWLVFHVDSRRFRKLELDEE